MFATILFGYIAVALLVATGTIVRATRQRTRRDELIDNVDRAVLVSVALLASVFWAVLFPFFAFGWLASPEARAFGTRAAHTLRLRRREPVLTDR